MPSPPARLTQFTRARSEGHPSYPTGDNKSVQVAVLEDDTPSPAAHRVHGFTFTLTVCLARRISRANPRRLECAVIGTQWCCCMKPSAYILIGVAVLSGAVAQAQVRPSSGPKAASPGPDTSVSGGPSPAASTPMNGEAVKGAEPLAPEPRPAAAGDKSQPPTLEEFLKPTFRVRGLIETEAVMAGQSRGSKATIGDLQNGYGFRRVRLGAQGVIGDSSRWVSEVELAGGNVQLLDVFVGLTAIPGVREVRVGHFREPFSLEAATGVPFVTFLERSPLNELDPARNWGVCGFWWPDDERMMFALGAFRNGANNAGQNTGDQDTWSYTARLTGLPITLLIRR